MLQIGMSSVSKVRVGFVGCAMRLVDSHMQWRRLVPLQTKEALKMVFGVRSIRAFS